MVKKILIRVASLLVIFLAAIFIIGKIINRDTPDTTQELNNATLPMVYMMNNDKQINGLHGYVKEMDVTALRDALTPVDSERTLQIQIQPYQKKVESISFEVLTSDGKTSHENTKVTKIQEDENYVNATLELQNKILINTEYMLKIAVTAGGEEVYYYTRIIREDGLNAEAYVDFVMGFYESCINGNDLNISELVEPDPEADDSTLSYVDIHSDIKQIIWADLQPQVYYKPTPSIRELNENTATIAMEYMVSANGEEDSVELYHVSEYYRMRYTDSRILLLDFERSTSEVFNPENQVLNENGILLGVAGRDITYKNDTKNNFFAFVRESALWTYDVKDNKLAQVLSFPQEKNSDVRDMYNQNDIQIISIDEQGNMYFLVCGYMNRGIHEGESGVAVYYYDAMGVTVSECLFVDTKQAYPLLKKDANSLAYVSEDKNHFYLLVDGEVYGIDMTTRQVTSIASGLAAECYGGSASGKQFAWTKENEMYNSKTIMVMDLDNHDTREISCGDNERIKILGFIDEDLVYGVANAADINISHVGNEIFPMNKVLIVNRSGAIVKEYVPQGSYVSGAVIEDKLMRLNRIQKVGDQYEEVEDDHIVNSVADEDTSFGFSTITSERRKELRILKVGSTLSTVKPPQVVKSRFLIYEGSKEIALEPKEKKDDAYYVYAKGYLDSIYPAVNQAIQRADEALGVVVDGQQQIVWERGNKKTKLDLNVETFPAAFLEYTMDVNTISGKMDQTVLDLSGCTMEQALYFVSEGTPVLAQTNKGPVIIGGYDEYNTRLLLKGDAELSYAGLQDSTDMFEDAGNIFITYLDPLTD